MTARKEYDYPLAPLTVTTHNGRLLDFEVNRDGSIEIVAEVDDLGSWSAPRTMEVSFILAAGDWAAVVAHIAADSAELSAPVIDHFHAR